MGGKQLRGLGGAGRERMGKAMGKGHHDRDLAQRIRTSQQKWIFSGRKKNLGLKKKVLWQLCDASKLRLKGSSFVERLGWFFASPSCGLPRSWKKKIGKNWAILGVWLFRTREGNSPGNFPLPPTPSTTLTPTQNLPARKR